MQKRQSFFSYFLILLIISLIIFAASKIGLLAPVESLSKAIVSPIQALTYGIYSKLTNFGNNRQVQNLKNQNLELTKKLVNLNKLLEDNKALRDQFQTQNPKSTNLLEANVIAAPGFMPGFSVPEFLILDRGENDGLKVGQAVVYEDNLVGEVLKTSKYLSSVELITNFSSSLTAKTLQTGALGVAKGQGGGGIFLDNVVLSDTLQKGDLVLSKGDFDALGIGIPPDLVIGQIESISKFPSDLFQKARLKSKLDFIRLDKVFVEVNY